MRFLILCFAYLMVSGSVWSQDQAEPTVDFNREVLPILAKRCFHCHGPETAESGLRLDSREGIVQETETGLHAVIPGKPDESELLARILETDESLRMPPEGEPLTKSQIETLREWIATGAEWKKHWAFETPTRPEVPAVKNAAWVSSPIDAFVLSRLESAGLTPADPADKVQLLRRVTYNLTGLPPTPQELAEFLADNSPTAYETVVDRLLASPHYGEKWGRAWLDLVRYAETNSFERDNPKPNAWRYRDYVIRSMNDDKPYDQFIREQLAGDEVREPSVEEIVATGYYRLGLWDDEPADPLLHKFDQFDDIVRTTGEVFLGLTVGCARCHDHKIDPIPQADYYSFLAFFRGLSEYGRRGDERSNSQWDITPPEVTKQYQALDRKKAELVERMREIEQKGIVKMSAEDQRATEGRRRERVLKMKLKRHLSDDDWTHYRSLKERLASVEREYRELPDRLSAMAVVRVDREPKATNILLRGSPHAPGDVVQPSFPSIFGDTEPKIEPNPRSSGRRTALADWIASDDNLLTARVMANRIWQHHFGRGIVKSPNNFGLLGEPPTHPKLLDWLAAELIRNDWHLKAVHREILLSSTYRMSSQSTAEGLAKDPGNDLFWRFNMRRLTAEEIRDSVHVVTGVFNPEMFGPSIYPQISQEVLKGQSRPGAGWGKSPPEEQARRSIYIHAKRSLVTPLLSDFDVADTDNTCPVRFVTVQPAQALNLLNGEFLNGQAQKFASRVRHQAGDDRSEQVRVALALALSRPPKPEEIEWGVELIEKLDTEQALSEAESLKYFCLVVLNLNEFIYLD
ncbi:PSD1 and planctomycete cytochrome C domain-containing protein [Thalassoroseus pseudoceratinae]|uniref:PSD1 and planctomycete cytochrome C domain-containing protein n=1 Tax=Thalassoroseus pseudoceratinae TaxID=2713176 RepID=UPI0019810E1F|nr:PSD1 and planctomycete cytochrome C domain-containing protein [Thalassoroseus pseudoceratinae]